MNKKKYSQLLLQEEIWLEDWGETLEEKKPIDKSEEQKNLSKIVSGKADEKTLKWWMKRY